jgi:Zn-dependent M28 family amino/carboxypeptidase
LEIAGDEESPEASNLVYGWIKEENGGFVTAISNGEQNSVKIKSSGAISTSKPSKNVIGVIEGTDPVLKNEFLLISAHYDHVGVGKQGSSFFTAEDSIFNGARDNGIGTVALLSAAKSLAQSPPKRSVIFLAFTAEEMGLLGSSYYTEHPLIPLKQTIFNLNSDGAGYDDIEAISIIGYDRVGVIEEFNLAANKFGLRIIADPAPEQNLFDRSDNVNFAAKGIPAPSVSPGTTGFTEEIAKYYHQAIDNPESIDYDYLLVFCKTFSYMARLIADKDKAPQWSQGDKYEEAGKKLYEN